MELMLLPQLSGPQNPKTVPRCSFFLKALDAVFNIHRGQEIFGRAFQRLLCVTVLLFTISEYESGALSPVVKAWSSVNKFLSLVRSTRYFMQQRTIHMLQTS